MTLPARWRCPRCHQTRRTVDLSCPPTCSCGLTADGRPRLKPITMIDDTPKKDEQDD